MHLSRELAIEEMESVRRLLKQWIDELEKPAVLDRSGKEKELFPDGIPQGLSVADVQSIPVLQLRAELNVAAAKLEALAST